MIFKIYFSTLWYFLKAILTVFFFPEQFTPLYQSGKKLLFEISLRSEEKHQWNILTYFRLFAQIIFACFKVLRDYCKFNEHHSFSFIYDVSGKNEKMRLKYINFYSPATKIRAVIGKSELRGVINILYAPLHLFSITVLFFVMLFPVFFVRNKASLAWIFYEFTETVNLLLFLRKNEAKELYYFCIYEKDSNLCAYLLQKNGIKVVKIASEVPLGFWNSIIVADKLIICFNYQYEEIKHFQKTMFVESTESWGPERAPEVYCTYRDKRNVAPFPTVGFYSTAAWVRGYEGHADTGINLLKNESILKESLKEYLMKNPNGKLLIFLHPRERIEKYLALSRQHYEDIFSGINYEFASFDVPSSEGFHLADTGVAFISSIIYERLYFGFKSILMPLSIKDFPLPGSSISNICVFSKEELFQKLDKAMRQNASEFFRENKIEHYTFLNRN